MSKKSIKMMAILLIIAVLFSSVSIISSGYNPSGDPIENGYSYKVIDGTAKITGFAPTDDLVIPATLGGYPVTDIEPFGIVNSSFSGIIIVDENNEYLSADEYGVLFDKNKTKLIHFPASIEISEYKIPETVTSIGAVAFGHNSSVRDGKIEKLIVPAGLEKIVNMPNSHSFYHCSQICEFVVDENNKYFSSMDGVLFNKDKTVLVAFPSAKEHDEYVVPASVREISYHGGTCSRIGTLRFEKGSQLESFNGGAFSFSQIQNLILPPSVTFENIFFGDAAFYNVTFEDGRKEESITKTIQGNNVSRIVLPESVSYIAKGALTCFSSVTILNPFCELEEESVMAWSGVASAITGYEKSTAHDYALKYNAEFTALECTHSFGFSEWIINEDETEATCECLSCYYTKTKILEKYEDNDVEIIAPVQPDCDFDSEQIVDKNDDRYMLVEEKMDDNGEVVKIFDINLKNKDGVHVQPDGTVKVKLPHDWKHENYKVYRINDDGTYTDMNAYRQGSHIVFETDHFSIYVIIDESIDIEDDTIDSDTENENTDFFTKLINCFMEILNKISEFFKSLF